MQVRLNRADQDLVEARLRSGQFRSAEEMISCALQLLVGQEQELERERSEIRAVLDERWQQATKPGTEWLDGEEVIAELEGEIEQHEKTRHSG
jgi:Arc/MetJ-type ribon-helix-helix transcriptional regulator